MIKYYANISKKLGQNFKKIRLKRNLSQARIAKQLKVDRAYVSSLENGKKNPTLKTINKLAKMLNVPINRLLK